jgi:rhodanese-related sulfurtransferase
MKSIDVTELSQMLSDENASLLLDVREPWEFEHCNINGSVNIPLSEIPSRLQELGEKNDIVVICHHGGRSWQVASFLENQNICETIMNLEGGIDAWAIQIDPEMPRY